MTKGKRSEEIIYPEIEDFERMVNLLREFREIFSEDIPEFYTRYPGQLESILEQIRAIYFGKELYNGVLNKSAWFFYCLNKNHPFLNGNKRVAILGLFEFLKNNVSELYISFEAIFGDKHLYRMTIRTAESKPEEQKIILRYLKRKIRSFIIQF